MLKLVRGLNMEFLLIILWIIIGYLIGSISWALIIGKVFFHKDIREYGSGNLGGTNAGRVLGKPIGLLVIVLDALKALILMIICNYIFPPAIAYAGLAVSVGHCFPIFAQFKGGKGVACAFGYLLGLGLFVTGDVIFIFLYPLLIFLFVLGLSKMVSLSSMIALISATIIGFITFDEIIYAYLILILCALVIFRHIPNIIRIIKGKENKVSFIK